MFRKKIVIAYVLVTGLVICGCFFLMSELQMSQEIQKQEQDRSVVVISADEERALVFYKDDCSDCQRVFPMLYKENKSQDNLVFVNLNQQENKKYILEYQLQTVPTIVTSTNRYAGTDTKKIQEILTD